MKILLLIVFLIILSGCNPQDGEYHSQDELLKTFELAMDGANHPDNLFVDDHLFEKNYDRLPRQGRVKNPWAIPEMWGFDENGIAKRETSSQLSPAEKYDLAFNGGVGYATTWESNNHGLNTPGLESWWGHCHATAAVVARELEPRCWVEYNGIQFSPLDIMALLTEIYFNATTGVIGQRCEHNEVRFDRFGRMEENTCQDLNPAGFHIMLANYLGVDSKSPIIDLDEGREVWNAPIVGYRTLYSAMVSPQRAMRLITGKGRYRDYQFNPYAARLIYVRTEVTISFKSLKNRTYEYILELDDNGEIIGGEWVGLFRKKHPDIMWYPTAPQGGNPWVSMEQVRMLAKVSQSCQNQ